MKIFVSLIFALSALADTPLLRINAGGSTVQDPTGVWLADKYFVGGAVYTAGVPASAVVAPIDKDCRNGVSFSYQLPLPNGSYRIVMRFMEVFANYPNRTFNVAANGTPVLTNFNVFAEAGGSFTTITKTIPVIASNLQGVELKFTAGTKSAIVSAIEVYSNVVKPDEWCPSPALSRLDDTTLVIGPNWSPNNPCYLNFNVIPPASVDPINSQRLTAPITVKVNGDLTGDIYVWATAPIFGTPITPTAVVVGSTTNGGPVTCPNSDCTFTLMTNKMFPQNTAPIGTINFVNGILGPKANNIMDGNRQITIGPGAAMSLTIADGVLFAALEPAKMQQILQAQRLQQAQTEAQINQNNYLSNILKSAPLPVQKLDSLEKEMTSLRQQVGQFQNLAKRTSPVSQQELQDLRMRMDNMRQMYQYQGPSPYYRPEMMGNVQDMARQVAFQAVAQMGSQRQMFRMPPPTTDPKAHCSLNQWSEDSLYHYECDYLGKWVRYRVERNWKPIPVAPLKPVVPVPQTQIGKKAK